LQITTHKILTYFIAVVWLLNGLYCKVLNLVPRHQQIVAGILGSPNSVLFTKAIGILEMLMAVWILSHIKSRLCSVAQILIIAAMNTLEFFLVPDLLLFGKMNAIIAILFMALIYFNEFVLQTKSTQSV
jgi:uncharacterized membrane protein